jgi:hypothetical protein
MVTNLGIGQARQGWPWSSANLACYRDVRFRRRIGGPDLRAHMEDGEGLRAELSQTYEAHVQLTGMVILQSIAW